MYKIVSKKKLNEQVYLFEILAPAVARKAKAGQFIILIIDERGERIPLTVFRTAPAKGVVSIISQIVGKTTAKLAALKAGDSLRDFVGPLGKATEVKKFGKVICVGGGVGVAEICPIAKAMKAGGNRVSAIIGARNKELLILEDEMRKVSDEVYITTDDGSYQRKGLVTDVLGELLAQNKYDLIYAIGPLVMMKAVAEVSRSYKIKTVVSLNSIMVDGTGMCGSCRVTVGGEVKFACVDGPDFDGHHVDFAELRLRQDRFLREEEISLARFEKCQEQCVRR